MSHIIPISLKGVPKKLALHNLLIPAPVKDSSDNPPAPAAGFTGADLARLRPSVDSSVSDNTRVKAAAMQHLATAEVSTS